MAFHSHAARMPVTPRRIRFAVSVLMAAVMIVLSPGFESYLAAAETLGGETSESAPAPAVIVSPVPVVTGMPEGAPNAGNVDPVKLNEVPPSSPAQQEAAATKPLEAEALAASATNPAANARDLGVTAAAAPASAAQAAKTQEKDGKQPDHIGELSRQLEFDFVAAQNLGRVATDDAEVLGRRVIDAISREIPAGADGAGPGREASPDPGPRLSKSGEAKSRAVDGKRDPVSEWEARQSQSVPRRVGALRVQVQENPAAAFQEIAGILENRNEGRYEIRVAALRALAEIKTEAADAELLRALQNEQGYYLKIEAAKMVGAATSRIPKEKAVPVLEALYQTDKNQSVRIAARWALGQYGIEKPEVSYDYKQVLATAWTKIRDKLGAYRPKILAGVAVALGVVALARAYAAGSFTFAGAWNVFLAEVIPVAGFVMMCVLVGWLLLRGGGGGSSAFTKMPKIKAERPDVTFADIAGIDDAMVDIQELVEILKDPVRFKRLGAKIPKGVLLKGPPGTGKTLMAKALAGSAGVPFFSMSGSDFNEVFVGVGSKRVRDLFEQAKKHSPSIIFIDEFDAVAKTRNGFPGSGESNNTLNALLTEMDGFNSKTDVIVIAATNLDASLDPAATRPGRFDRSVYVGNPHVLGREAILQIHAKSRRLGPDVNLRRIAERTPGFSGAALATLVNEAALLAARRWATTVEMKDFDAAVDKMLVGAARELFMSRKVMERTAEHEIGHVLGNMLADATLEEVLKDPQKIASIVSIVPRGEGTLGYAHSSLEEDNPTQTKRWLENRLVTILGGYVAEEVVYGDVSTGPGSDLRSASAVARMMVETAGFSKKLGLEVTAPNANGLSPVSEKTKELKDSEVRRILNAAHRRMTQIFKKNAELRELLVKELLEKETLSREEMLKIIREYAQRGGK